MEYHLAQINIAKIRAPLNSPVMTGFVNNLERINSLAEQQPGFIWRLKDEHDNATALRIFDDNFLIVNMSVWTSVETLFTFTYQTDHVEIFKKRKEWFSKIQAMHMACWYVPQGEIPTAMEAKQRLAYLNAHGETPYAFTFKNRFSAEEAADFTVGSI